MAETAFDALLALDAAAREHAAAETAGGTAVPGHGSAVLARVAGRVLRLPLQHVRELRRCPVLAPLPGAQQWLAGATAWQGRAIAVLDLARFAFDAEAERGDTLLVCAHDDTVVGLRVDAVLDTAPGADAPDEAGDGAPRALDTAALLADPRLAQAGRWPRARRRAPAEAGAEHADER